MRVLPDHFATPEEQELNLQLIVVGQSDGANHSVPATFEECEGFHRWWWHPSEQLSGGAWVSLTADGFEVARAKIRIPRQIGDAYPTAHPLPDDTVQIDLLEVHAHYRHSDACAGKGYGRAAVAALTARWNRPMIAAAKNEPAAAFWRSIGWVEHAHMNADPDEFVNPMPLFVSPYEQ